MSPLERPCPGLFEHTSKIPLPLSTCSRAAFWPFDRCVVEERFVSTIEKVPSSFFINCPFHFEGLCPSIGNLGRCCHVSREKDPGRWSFASMSVPMGDTGRCCPPPAASRCGGCREAVSRIRQSSTAGQPDTSGAMRDLLAAEPLRKSQIKGNEVWETVSGRARHRLPSGLSPQPPGEIIARETVYRRDCQCPESGHLT